VITVDAAFEEEHPVENNTKIMIVLITMKTHTDPLDGLGSLYSRQLHSKTMHLSIILANKKFYQLKLTKA